ncbi:MAG: GatB/YqeY domain-containing protein [Candidatus Omnitrophica bacterium]|nr:GatB/YqeY domain-containing protein [Candidatus Omnitrophota bacterium]
MTLYEKINQDMKDALKQGDAVKLSALRMLIAAIKLQEIDENLKALDEDDIVQIVRKQVKQHKESIEQFEKGKRQDLADKELKELKVLETYMPQQLSQEEVLAIVKAALAETGAVARSDAGKVMKIVMEKVKGKADGKAVSQLVMSLLK